MLREAMLSLHRGVTAQVQADAAIHRQEVLASVAAVQAVLVEGLRDATSARVEQTDYLTGRLTGLQMDLARAVGDLHDRLDANALRTSQELTAFRQELTARTWAAWWRRLWLKVRSWIQ